MFCMIKGKIAGVKHFDASIFVRIKIDNKTKKRYTQFRQKLSNKYKVSKYGNEGFTKLLGNGIDINIFKGEKYLHVVVYGKNRKNVLGILMENFEFLEYKTNS